MNPRKKPKKKARKPSRTKPGEKVVLTKLPPDLRDGLPDEDQRAISDIVGKTITLNGYDKDGRAELEWWDYRDNTGHTIWVNPQFVRSW